MSDSWGCLVVCRPIVGLNSRARLEFVLFGGTNSRDSQKPKAHFPLTLVHCHLLQTVGNVAMAGPRDHQPTSDTGRLCDPKPDTMSLSRIRQTISFPGIRAHLSDHRGRVHSARCTIAGLESILSLALPIALFLAGAPIHMCKSAPKSHRPAQAILPQLFRVGQVTEVSA